MTTKHTPGDWEIIERGIWDIEIRSEGTVFEINQKGGMFPSGNGSYSGRSHNKMLADARLIASAPDLLAVLTKIRGYHVNHHVLHEIDAAITKATGEAPKDDDSEVPA